jgi:hypothetical protein
MTLEIADMESFIEAIAERVALKMAGISSLGKAAAVEIDGTLRAVALARRPVAEQKAYFDALAKSQKAARNGRKRQAGGAR